jgi:hypothetical protein
MKTKPRKKRRKRLCGPEWFAQRHKKNLINHLKRGGAVVHSNSGMIFYDLRFGPYELEMFPDSFQICTSADLMKKDARAAG